MIGNKELLQIPVIKSWHHGLVHYNDIAYTAM